MRLLDHWLQRAHAVRNSALLGSIVGLLMLCIVLLIMWVIQQQRADELSRQTHRLAVLQQQVETLQQQHLQQQKQLTHLAEHHWLKPNWHVLLQSAEQSHLTVVHYTQVDNPKQQDRTTVMLVLQGQYNALLRWLRGLSTMTAGLHLAQWQLQPAPHHPDQVSLSATLVWMLAHQNGQPIIASPVALQALPDPFQFRATTSAAMDGSPWQLVGTLQAAQHALALFSVGDELVSRQVGEYIGQHQQYQLVKIDENAITLNQQDKDVSCTWRIGGTVTCDISP